ncbi:MAG: pyridoxal phosphate-dependent aminotransferase family protein [Bacteroidales bacterium]|nr:pyridoxal phosphate-dependent aminotransferase family protein [Bacteroidales bacterium]MCF8455559.1 pyridoxal phosphate-dependent aminotransferase family protein [Bacteroidales bacterium]
MSLKQFYDNHIFDDSLKQKTLFNPYYVNVQSGLDDALMIDGKEFINLAANNYLGLANDERLKKAAINAIQKYGQSLCATPIASGCADLFESLSQKISNFVGLESSVFYPSCYQANNGLFQAIAGKDDVIIIDRFSHSSLVEGARTVGCKLRPFLHNNMASLEKNLQHSSKHKQIFVVTESVFSTEGSIAPFAGIVELCKRYDAVPVIDDSHGLGVIGKRGRGIIEHAGIVNYEGIYTASLGKAMANQGGVVCGKKSLIDYLKYNSSHLIYSTAITPSILAGIQAVIEIIESEFDVIGKRMWYYRNKLRDALIEFGFDVKHAEAPITSILTGSSEETILFAKHLYQKGILATPFIYPSVPENQGVIRMIVGANLKEPTLDKAIEILKTLKPI